MAKKKGIRIIFLTMDSIYSNMIYNRIMPKLPNNEIRVIKTKGYSKKDKHLLFYSIKYLWMYGLRFSRYLFFFVVAPTIFISLSRLLHKLHIINSQKRISLKQICSMYDAKYEESSDINSDEEFSKIKRFKPDLILSFNYNQILEKRIFNIPKYGSVNLHPGYLPNYPGLFSTFWSILGKRGYGGASLFYIDEGIDTGEIISRKKISYSDNESLMSINLRINRIGADMIIKFVDKILNKKKIKRVKQLSKKKNYYSYPTKMDVKNFKKIKHKFMKIKEYLSFFF